MPLANDDSPKTRRHVHIDDDDWEWLSATFASQLGISRAIRLIIKSYRQRILEQQETSNVPRPPVDIEHLIGSKSSES